jgi:hypothetical protein
VPFLKNLKMAKAGGASSDTGAFDISLLAVDYGLQLINNYAIMLISNLPIPKRAALDAGDL